MLQAAFWKKTAELTMNNTIVLIEKLKRIELTVSHVSCS